MITYDLVSERHSPVDVQVNKPADIFPLLKRYSLKKQENFVVITLDAGNRVIKVHLVSIGLLNRTLIHPREVFIRAIRDNCASVILAHNHPSGSLEPSREDREATTRLAQAGKILGIEVLDHLIVSKTGFLSFKESGEALI